MTAHCYKKIKSNILVRHSIRFRAEFTAMKLSFIMMARLIKEIDFTDVYRNVISGIKFNHPLVEVFIKCP